MSELTMDRLRENLESLKMKNTLEILDNYLERAIAENLNIVEVLDHIFSEEAKSKRKRAYEKQVQMSGFPIKKTLDDFDFSFQPSIDKRQIDELATMRFLENGENVSPEELENLLYKDPLVKEALVRESGSVIEAEIFPDEEYAKKKKIRNMEEHLQALVNRVNEGQPPYKKIHSLKVRNTEFQKTSSKKIKRNQ